MNNLMTIYRGAELLRSARIIGVGLVPGLLPTSSPRPALQMNTWRIQLNKPISDAGNVPPDSTTQPWMDIVFKDIAPNTVRLTITAPHLTGPELDQYLYFNFNDTKNVNNLVFTPVLSQWQGVSTSYSLQ